LIDDIERHESGGRLIVLPPPCPLRIQPIDFGHADELITRALHDAREFLDGGGQERPAIGDSADRPAPAPGHGLTVAGRLAASTPAAAGKTLGPAIAKQV
jgi:hypothetical protein